MRWKNERAGIIKINEDEGSGEGAIIASLLKLCPEVKINSFLQDIQVVPKD